MIREHFFANTAPMVTGRLLTLMHHALDVIAFDDN